MNWSHWILTVKATSKSRIHQNGPHVGGGSNKNGVDKSGRGEAFDSDILGVSVEEECSCGSTKTNSKCNFKWPNDNLGARYNNFGKSDLKYKQLDLRLLVAGELNIMMCESTGEREQAARMQLLSDVVFNSAHYQWQAVLKFHAAVLSEVESHRLKWGGILIVG